MKEVTAGLKVVGDALAIQVAGAEVKLPAATIAELWLAKVKESAANKRIRQLQEERTPIGALGLHGIYAGIARGADDAEDHILEVLEQEPPKDRMTWAEAKAWAESIGGALPTRREAALLYANVPELFDAGSYYWTGEEYAGHGGYAWYQNFDDGYQDYYHKDNELRARAVRRIPLAI